MLKKVDKGLTMVENAILVFGLLSATIILFVNVVMRYFLKSGLVWAEEYARFAIIWIVLGGCAAAVRTDAHMKITAIPDAIKNINIKLVLQVAVIAICLVFSAMLLVSGISLTVSMFQNHQVSPAMEIPLWWIYIAIPIGGLGMIVRYIQSLVRLFTDYKTAKENQR